MPIMPGRIGDGVETRFLLHKGLGEVSALRLDGRRSNKFLLCRPFGLHISITLIFYYDTICIIKSKSLVLRNLASATEINP